MRRLSLLALACAAALSLAGCITTKPDGSPAVSLPAVPSGSSADQVINTVIADVQKGCGWVVEYRSIADMVAAFGVPYIGMAADFASQVCGALIAPPPSNARASRRPVVEVKGKVIVIRAQRA